MITSIIILVIFSVKAMAPVEKVLYIERVEPMSKYDRLIKAVVHVESRGNNYALNVTEQAVGAFQIRQCRIDHYNRMTGAKYKLSDCFDFEISRKVFLYFADGKSYEKAARDWNGKWSLTEGYWNKIKKVLVNQK